MERLTRTYNPWVTAGAVPDDGRGDHILPGTPGYTPPAPVGTTVIGPDTALAPPSAPIGQTGAKVPGTVAVSIQSVANDMHDTDYNVPVGGTVLCAANPNRRYLLIQNKDAVNPIFVRIGVSQASGGVKIVAGGYYELEFNVPVSYIFAYSTGGNVIATVVEGSVQGN